MSTESLTKVLDKWLQQLPTTRSSDMDTKTGNTYISVNRSIKIDKIPTANSRFSTMVSSIMVSLSDCNNDRQLKMARLAAKTAPMLPYFVVVCCCSCLVILSLTSPWLKMPDCRWNVDHICHSSRGIYISGVSGHIAIFSCPSLIQSLANTFTVSLSSLSS